jgi:hypothetical protein
MIFYLQDYLKGYMMMPFVYQSGQNPLMQTFQILFKRLFGTTILCIGLFLNISLSYASCPSTTPWSTPVDLSDSGLVTSNIFSAATSAGFMAVWADSSNNAHYSFSTDGLTWQTGLINPAAGNVAPVSDVFVAGNASGFIVTWIDSANNAFSSFSTNNGVTWSAALQINPNSLALNSNSDVYVAGGTSGFVATLIGADNNAYVSFSTGSAGWSAPTQVTSNGSVHAQNQNSQTGRGFVGAVVAGDSCMLVWIIQSLGTNSAYFDSINPFSSTTVYPVVSVGFFESAQIVAQLNGYFMNVGRANIGNGVTYFSVATIPSNWATFSLFLDVNNNPDAGPWIAANEAGFLSAWVVGASQGSPGSPYWTFTSNNGFNLTPLCSILATPSTTIGGPVGLSANSRGFVATWLDSNDGNAYASFYAGPIMPPTNVTGCSSQNIFLLQKVLFNQLSWAAPLGGITPVSYKIYRDAGLTDLVATIPSTGPLQYTDQNTQAGVAYTYYIVSVDQNGDISSSVQITVTPNC